MEDDIQDSLREYFNRNINIEVEYKDIRKYQIHLQIAELEHEFTYGYNAHLTFDANIDIIKKEIEQCIIKYYLR